MSDPLVDELKELLAKPTPPPVARRRATPAPTRKVEVEGDRVVVEAKVSVDDAISDSTALRFLEDEKMDPTLFRVKKFRKSEWGDGQESVRIEYERKEVERETVPVDDLMASVLAWDAANPPQLVRKPLGGWGYIVALGDTQLGKIDGDGAEGTVKRVLAALREAKELFHFYNSLYPISHVHIAWLGDHVEGFSSQGGANVWRTQLTMNEQIRLTRRLMFEAVKLFAPLAAKVTVAAVPGNHGEPQRFMGTGLTRYDDSHDTESLIAVAETCAELPERFGHVSFMVPETDELTVVCDVAGTRIGHAHGHKWRVGKHFDYWEGQAFNPDSGFADVDLLLAGHGHTEKVESSTRRLYVQVPAFESESTWFRHQTGAGGDPGLMVLVTRDGYTPIKHKVRGV